MTKMLSISTMLTAACCFAFGTAATAHADELTVEQDEETRDGLLIGVGVGAGHMECDGPGCDGMTEAVDLNAQIGVVAVPALAVMGDVWAMGHRDDRLTVMHGMATLGPQVWIGPLWLRGGLGVARVSFDYNLAEFDIGDDEIMLDVRDQTDTVPAASAAVGLEVLATNDFALSAQLRGGTGFFHDGDTEVHNLSLGVGASWY